MTRIVTRACSPADTEVLVRHGLHPVLARLYASRGICQPDEIETGLARLIPPASMKGLEDAAVLLADALEAECRMLVVADYDCDGATACAVAVRGLRMFGAQIDYLVPNRFEYGYGLTPEIVALAAQRKGGPPDVLITVDNGIASVEGVEAANELGIEVLVTDHHLPGDTLPDARAIVNPNQPGCEFPSKCIAGVGVMFYTLLALRAELRKRGAFADGKPEPRLDGLLDLVALGTVADVVKLDGNNRVLVAQGLQRIRNGRMQPGIAALFRAAAREAKSASGFDLGFALGPRLNAAGRLSDMSLGIECLTTDDVGRAWELAQQLDGMNRERREIEAGMQQQALADLADIDPQGKATLTLFNEGWHQGVIGIVAGRLKEKFHRPSFTFAPADDGALVKGSGRSIPGFHLRDAVDLISKREPGLIHKFGGHAMAAGMTIAADDVPRFAEAFERVGREWLTEEALARTVETDGDLEDAYFTPDFVEMLDAAVWGQGFPAPVFAGEFEVASQALVKDKHLKLQLLRGRQRFNAIWFNHTESLPQHTTVAYRLVRDTWNGVSRVQLVVEHAAL